uniref:Uncharacterized protein n=1 Tax=Pyrodinium bahamense TaxID=73915 RepID=A0A7S0FHQ3_9DINO|mmetsp:Transcript_32557/g.89814  ORF Transcript_32557/g.89814 Transcript_32557/m.89814 type:complete len:335 (+) Transcript_32557:1-1005(+)
MADADVAGLITEAASQPISRIVPVPQTAYVLGFPVSDTDKVTFTAIRTMGAMIAGFRLNDVHLILETPSIESGMQGSTFWPSPQSAWNWPPPPTISGGGEFDGKQGRAAEGGGSYDVQVDEDKQEVLFTSQPDPKLGVRVTKRFTVDQDRKAMVLRYTMESVNGSKPIKLAPWEKTNVRKGAFIFWQHGKSEAIYRTDDVYKPGKKKALAVDGDTFAFDHGKENVHVNGTKIIANTTSSWIACVQGQTLFVKVFQSVPANQVAPGEGDMAVFARPSFASMENQGAFQEISKGKASVYVVCWYARPLPAGAKPLKDDKPLMDAVASIVKLGCPDK